MSFIPKGDLNNANSGRVMIDVLLASSTKFELYEAVKFDGLNGEAVLWGAGGTGAGIIHGFKKADGSPITDNGAGADNDGTYTTPASNTVLARVDISKTSLYSVPLDAAAGTTTGSDEPYVNFDAVSTSLTLDESTVVAAGTTASFMSLGLDPDPKAATNAVIVKIQESQLDI